MRILASVSWNSDTEFEKTDLVDIILSFENDGLEFRGQLKRADTTIDYLKVVAFYANNMKTSKVGNPIQESEGKRIYEIPVSPDADLNDVIIYSERIQKKYYIVERDEWVTDEEYCKFFGSSGNIWDTNKCNYPEGDFVETLRQTAYDMEHGNPYVWLWANVPKINILRMEKNAGYAKFINSIEDLNKSLRKAENSTDTAEIIRLYNKIADVAEKYKQKRGIERL